MTENIDKQVLQSKSQEKRHQAALKEEAKTNEKHVTESEDHKTMGHKLLKDIGGRDHEEEGMDAVMTKPSERPNPKEECGTQRVYKKTSPNCLLTLYLPTREIVINSNSPALIQGIVFVDPNIILQGCRICAQLTLTFRYGREDEEVMGLRFCNEAIMSLDQLWPQTAELDRDNLTPLQEALRKRLGETAYPFALTLTPQAPPSVQLVPAKRYYGAPIGTSYDVRCFIVDKTDDKFHRRAVVKMGVRVIIRSDIYTRQNDESGPENYATLSNNSNATSPLVSTPVTIKSDDTTIESMDDPRDAVTATMGGGGVKTAPVITTTSSLKSVIRPNNTNANNNNESMKRDGNAGAGKSRKATERSDSFAKLRLSPKSFRFSGRFSRSKSEVEKSQNDQVYSYSKSFQEINTAGCGTGGPQGAIDKPFLLQDGRVSLRASLDKSWYAHGEEVVVTIHIRNDSRKTVRKVRVCAIQHVDVCMFNNGKFKNVVADTDIHSPVDRVVPPGDALTTSVKLKPQRGTTKNWLALEDSLQRSTEPEEIGGNIAASAVRSPQCSTQATNSPNYSYSPGVYVPSSAMCATVNAIPNDSANPMPMPMERNVFAIYVSYYVKVKLILSGMGGDLSLKLPFVLVHLNEMDEKISNIRSDQFQKLTLDEAPVNRLFSDKMKYQGQGAGPEQNLDSIESLGITSTTIAKRPPLRRCLTICKDIEEENLESFMMEKADDGRDHGDLGELKQVIHIAQVHHPEHDDTVPGEHHDTVESDTHETHGEGPDDETKGTTSKPSVTKNQQTT